MVVVGAGYGTPLVSRLLMDDPTLADGLLLIAPAQEHGKEKACWVSHVLESPFFR